LGCTTPDLLCHIPEKDHPDTPYAQEEQTHHAELDVSTSFPGAGDLVLVALAPAKGGMQVNHPHPKYPLGIQHSY